MKIRKTLLLPMPLIFYLALQRSNNNESFSSEKYEFVEDEKMRMFFLFIIASTQ
jgi:hypothetical protein